MNRPLLALALATLVGFPAGCGENTAPRSAQETPAEPRGPDEPKKAEEPKQAEEPKLVTDQLDKAFGVKLKSHVIKESPKQQTHTTVTLTLEFGQDVTDKAELKKAFFADDGIPLKAEDRPIVFYLFDADNVCVAKYTIRKLEGDLSGVKGDAFRITTMCFNEDMAKTRKIEVRLTNPPKGK